MKIFIDESLNEEINVLGAITVSDDEFFLFEDDVKRIRMETNFHDEMKWHTLSKSAVAFYEKVIPIFFKYDSLRFHSNSYLNQSQQYQVGYKLIETIGKKLLAVGIYEELTILFDETTKGGKEVKTTHEFLMKSRSFHHPIHICGQVSSHIYGVLQLTDFFTGCMCYKINNADKDNKRIKNILVNKLEEMDSCLGLDIDSTNDYKLWKYRERKIQHYNLHKKPIKEKIDSLK